MQGKFKTLADIQFHNDMEWEIIQKMNEAIEDYNFVFDEEAGHWLMVEQDEEE